MVKKIKRKGVKKIFRPRFGPAKTHGRLNPGTRFLGAHGSRRRDRTITTTSTTTTSTTTTTTV